jgi:hypothetical protein
MNDTIIVSVAFLSNGQSLAKFVIRLVLSLTAATVLVPESDTDTMGLATEHVAAVTTVVPIDTSVARKGFRMLMFHPTPIAAKSYAYPSTANHSSVSASASTTLDFDCISANSTTPS